MVGTGNEGGGGCCRRKARGEEQWACKFSQAAKCNMENFRVENYSLAHYDDRPKTRCVKCVPKCASVRVAPSNIVYYCTDIDPQGKVN